MLGVSCASSPDDPRIVRINGASRLEPPDAFGIPFCCKGAHAAWQGGSPLRDGKNCQATSATETQSAQPLEAVIIAGSRNCFERAKLLAALPSGVVAATWSHAALTWPAASSCADTQSQRMTDGTVLGHRAAWQMIVSANRSMLVLEEDAEFIGQPVVDVRAAVRRCEEAQCDVMCKSG